MPNRPPLFKASGSWWCQALSGWSPPPLRQATVTPVTATCTEASKTGTSQSRGWEWFEVGHRWHAWCFYLYTCIYIVCKNIYLVYVDTYTRMYINECIYIYMYIYIYVHLQRDKYYIYTYIYIYLPIYMRVYKFTYVYMYIQLYTCSSHLSREWWPLSVAVREIVTSFNYIVYSGQNSSPDALDTTWSGKSWYLSHRKKRTKTNSASSTVWKKWNLPLFIQRFRLRSIPKTFGGFLALALSGHHQDIISVSAPRRGMQIKARATSHWGCRWTPHSPAPTFGVPIHVEAASAWATIPEMMG